ncbi:MAG: phosphate acyltransferase PlsX [Pseudomonadota bacterium]
MVDAGSSHEPPRRSGGPGAVLAIDAMGGDHGPPAVVDGLAALFADPPASPLSAILHGDAAELSALVAARPQLAGKVRIQHADAVVAMDARPREALRAGRGSSMWRALSDVAEGGATVALSAGNTAALMTLAMVRLRPAPGVDRPAIAALWPSLGPAGWTVTLDMGADLRADPRTLAQYGLMGAEYARIALDLDSPRVALLNVGAEETKGRPELQEAAQTLAAACPPSARFVGFAEADAIGFDVADVIVTDGFTGNVALKSAEGAARLIAAFMREAFGKNAVTKLGALAATPALRSLKARMDPRRVNGGVFLGLNGAVVKSHGAADAVAFEAALRLAARIGTPARADDQAGAPARLMTQRIAARMAEGDRLASEGAETHSLPGDGGSEGDMAAGSG